MDKKNFEKDIDVPSKSRIMDDYNAKDCEQCSPDSVCCYCKNIAYYNLEEQLKNEKYSHEHTKVWIGEYIKKHPYRKDEYEQLKAELKSSKELRKYTYDCCKRAGEELAKNSFDWDGKEKNLVVQAIELNERFNQLKAENEHLSEKEEEAKHYLEEAEKFKNCLTEIKFWVRELLKRTGQVVPNEIKEILQIIRECEGNND